jgi:omega-6 fatty acid desaturase (delta-12 desaturase)
VAAALMKLYGLLILNPPSIWKRSHNHHHRNNSKIFGAQIGSYPVMTPQAYESSKISERFLYSLSRHPLTIATGYLTIFFYGMCLRSFLVSPGRHFDSAVSMAMHLSLVGLLAWASPMLLVLLVLMPMTIGSALGAYLFYVQHNFPMVKLRERADWDYLEAAMHSSSYLRMSPLLHWFTGNIGYHHVHHLNERIPFYRLPEAMAAIPELQNPGWTTLALKDIRQCLRLKFWDPERQRMVGYSDIYRRGRGR